jgi:hypothetical protein
MGTENNIFTIDLGDDYYICKVVSGNGELEMNWK